MESIKENEKLSVKDTLEIVEGIEGLISLFIMTFKDGYQSEDLMKIMMTLVSDEKFKRAIDGIGNVGRELGDLDISEIQLIISRLMSMGFNIFKEIKK